MIIVEQMEDRTKLYRIPLLKVETRILAETDDGVTDKKFSSQEAARN